MGRNASATIGGTVGALLLSGVAWLLAPWTFASQSPIHGDPTLLYLLVVVLAAIAGCVWGAILGPRFGRKRRPKP